jgi:hypothetical protein
MCLQLQIELPFKTNMVSREELYELVWSIPMIKVGEKFSVSGSYMARVCAALNVPRPERGYWAKLEVGKTSARPTLPDASPGDPLFWSQEGDLPATPIRSATVTSAGKRPRAGHIDAGTHVLIQGAKQHYERGYKVEEGQLLRPYPAIITGSPAAGVGGGHPLEAENTRESSLPALATSCSDMDRKTISRF